MMEIMSQQGFAIEYSLSNYYLIFPINSLVLSYKLLYHANWSQHFSKVGTNYFPGFKDAKSEAEMTCATTVVLHIAY